LNILADHNEQIRRISLKLQQLLKQHEILFKNKDKEKALISKLQKDSDEQEARLRDLEQQNLILKASLQALEPGEKKDLEIRLTQYIKNIDKSISLLSQ